MTRAFFLPREVEYAIRAFGAHSDDLELYLLERCRPVQSTGCWEWAGSRFRNGYGIARVGGCDEYAHRLSYQLYNGPLTASKPIACHRCDNPPCVNPEHLFAGSYKDNMRDAVEKGRMWWQKPETIARTRERVSRIFELRAAGMLQREIAAELGTHQAEISRVLATHAKEFAA
jgi:hypothetical protein